MQLFKFVASALGAALLVACGGGGNGDQSPKVTYSSVVSFGDSLSDPGAYKVAAISAAGGGMFTVNGISGAVGSDPVPSYVWAQLVSAAAVGRTSCAARVGGFGSDIATIAGCTNYAQGGSRVTNPMGVGNSVGVGYTAGALTEPVVTQVANYLAVTSGSRFTGKELVTVLAGGNDIFGLSATLTAAATAAGNAAFAQSVVTQLTLGAPSVNQADAQVAIYTGLATEAASPTATPTTIVTAAATAAVIHAATNGYTNSAVANAAAIGTSAGLAGQTAGNTYAATTGAGIAVAGMVTAATELSNSVKNMVSLGATHVVVLNLPDVSQTPYAVNTPGAAPLVLAMTQAFNAKLKADLTGVAGVLFINAFDENRQQILNPSQFGLSNVTGMACAVTDLNPTGTSFLCNSSNLTGSNTSRYLFADSVHPTPYAHKLLAQLVTKELVLAGWL